MATPPKTPPQSKALDKKTVPMKTPTKPTPKPAAKKAKATPVKVAKGGIKASEKPLVVQKTSKPAAKTPKKGRTIAEGRPSRAVPGAVVGRPTKFLPEFSQMLIDYFVSLSVPWTERTLTTMGGGQKIELTPCRFPNFARFAANIGVSRDTIHFWATEKDKDGRPVNPSFSDAYARARAIQEAVLLEGSMAGVFESRMAGLAAKNLIGWADKLEQTVDDVTGFSPEEKADLERSYEQAKLSGVWVKQKAEMQARKQALGDD